MPELFIGLMSGTSLDAVDAALVNLQTTPRLIATHEAPLPQDLAADLRALSQGQLELQSFGRLDTSLGELFAEAVLELLRRAGIEARQVIAIGSHGQTIYHHPEGERPFSLQIADPNIIAERTSITTVADFRRRDIAAGGQGAPLVPAFHAVVLRSATEDRAVLNIGGIANITLLPASHSQQVSGFDCGPGNTLMDHWARRHLGLPRDESGRWAAHGDCIDPLLDLMLQDPYFELPPPKSTGPEHFGPRWLQWHLDHWGGRTGPENVQATLLELTATSISDALAHFAASAAAVLVCGGGVHNARLMQRLQKRIATRRVVSTAVEGIDPDWMEAMAFAWLAQQTMQGKSANLPSVTGAKGPAALGGIYQA